MEPLEGHLAAAVVDLLQELRVRGDVLLLLKRESRFRIMFFVIFRSWKFVFFFNLRLQEISTHRNIAQDQLCLLQGNNGRKRHLG